MKKKIFAIAFAVLMMSSCMLLTGCFNDYATYWSVVPSDQPFYSTMTHSAKSISYNYDFEYNFTVIRKSATVADQERDVIYVEFSHDDKIDDEYDEEYTVIYVASKSFYLDGDEWVEDTSTFGPSWSKWSRAYGAMGKSGTYVELMTGAIWDRHFPHRLKTAETSEYIEYTFKHDEETFRISNNPYHVLLYYHMRTNDYQENHNATLVLGVSDFTIPHLNTITAQMLAD